MTEFPPEVAGIFDADRDPDHAGRDPLAGQLIVVLTAMAGRDRVAERRLHVAQAGGKRDPGERL